MLPRRARPDKISEVAAHPQTFDRSTCIVSVTSTDRISVVLLIIFGATCWIETPNLAAWAGVGPIAAGAMPVAAGW